MATIGSFGDLHPYISLALEMKRRYIDPVIATSETYRERVESLGIEFHPIRPESRPYDLIFASVLFSARSYSVIACASFNSAFRKEPSTFNNRSSFLRLSRRARTVPRKNSS